jgi:hypothetical protein
MLLAREFRAVREPGSYAGTVSSREGTVRMDSGRSPGVTPEFLPHDASNAFPSGPGWLAANDIVAFYYCGNPDGFVRIIAPFFNAHDSAVRPDEDFRASRDFRG